MRTKILNCCIVVLWLVSARIAFAVQISPIKDNTLIEASNPTGQLSNGQGDVFVGRTAQASGSVRRGLVSFDIVANVPAGATITSAVLTMRETMGLNGNQTVELHRLLKDWGEGSSFFNGGAGSPAANGDVTWLYTFFNSADPSVSPTWTTPGGDYNATVSGVTIVSAGSGAQSYSWSSASNPQMLLDVQDWLVNPATNFGWIIFGNESVSTTAKRFNSGETPTPPTLTVAFTIPESSSFILALFAAIGVAARRICARRRNCTCTWPALISSELEQT